MSTRAVKSIRTTLVLLCAGLLSACASSVVVTGNIPTPLIPKLPLTATMTYSDEFRRYNYEEKEKGRALKNLEFGKAQVSMFNSVFRHILTLVDEAESGSKQFDLRIAPQLLDFQYSAPRDTKLNLYEVWLKYRLRITDAQDGEIADWVVKGYGKTPTATLSSAGTAFNSATNIALRDVGAQLSIGFARQDAIAKLLDAKTAKPGADESVVESAPLTGQAEVN
ncbi:MAG: hypothetical protein KJP04_05795 [Arenicella sp.]|nr:hypothetical protein [Arenicella sp.]